MPGLHETPLDVATGLPLPLLPVPARVSGMPTFYDYHHHFHPESDLVSGDRSAQDDGDLAVRMCRGQDLQRWLHEHYHHGYAGPRLPQTREQKFKTTLLACAGVVSRQVICLNGSLPGEIIEANNSQYRIIQRTVRHEGAPRGDTARFYRNRIGIFLANYAVERISETNVSDKTVRQFLGTTNGEMRRKEVGNRIISEAIRAAVEPIQPFYRELYKEGLVMPGKPTDLAAVVRDFFVTSRWEDYYEALEHQFAAASIAA